MNLEESKLYEAEQIKEITDLFEAIDFKKYKINKLKELYDEFMRMQWNKTVPKLFDQIVDAMKSKNYAFESDQRFMTFKEFVKSYLS